eukprot:gnl/MRDRNA2_/MRDRNA2_96709_c0_seq1.p1 gnl/MRDRNA2_/MRDRNA2_96709_c0~~gnl/MRDRNA2_/MRDRNA2_96709_c0_seq1.p1  ORF type:complete len:1652 (-),score=423.00 gnl/MRDRNA2_/MRDRNA2_96709_c0_seq1:82-5037(-)
MSLTAQPVGKDAFLGQLANANRAKAGSKTRSSAVDIEDATLAEDFDELDEETLQRLLLEEEEGFDDMPMDEVTSPTGFDARTQGPRKGGIFSTYRGKHELKSSLGDQSKLKNLERLRHEHSAKVAMAEDAKNMLDVEEQKLRALRRQSESNKLTDTTRITYQEHEVEKAWVRLTETERSRDLAELALHRQLEDSTHAERQTMQDVLKTSVLASQRQADETTRGKHEVKTTAEEDQSVKTLAENEAAEKKRRADEAKKHKGISQKRTHKSQSHHKERLKDAEQIREDDFQHQAKRLLELKSSINKINSHIQSQNEAQRKKADKLREEREQRKADLLAEGLNPYEVFRRDEMDQETEKARVEAAAVKQMRAEKLLQRLLEEDRRYKKKQKQLKEDQSKEIEFQQNQGGFAQQKKIANYIRRITIGNVDVLDPTGTAVRIDPSKVTVQRTHAFGLGRSGPEEIQKVERKLANAHKMMKTWDAKAEEEDEMDDMAEGLDAGEGEEDEGQARDLDLDLPEGKFWMPKLSKLEQQYMAAAMERQRQNITSVQRCWGKEFKGDAFLAKPSTIAFLDFEVGRRYKQVIEVTNVSLTFNQFKLLPLEDKIKDFFEIKFKPPGRMSAGVTCYITLWFYPKVNHDIKSDFPILAKTGHINFPLQCTTKKTILNITPQDADANPIIDFGNVLSGEVGHRTLLVKNSGALGTQYTLEPETNLEADNNFLRMLEITPKQGEFGQHATTKVQFTFKPEAIGPYATVLKLSINNGAVGDARLVETRRVLVQGQCIDVPIYVEKEEYNLKTCVYGHTFRENIVLHNRQSVAMKIQVERPKQVEGELQINPTVAYIQGQKNQAIQVKFCPRHDFLDRYPQYRDKQRPDELTAFRIPVKVVGADQVLPVCTALVGTLSTNDVVFEPPILNFGQCFVNAATMAELRIVNKSLLPQKFAFVRLPSFLSVENVPVDVQDEEKTEEDFRRECLQQGNLFEEDKETLGWGNGTAVADGGGYGAFGILLPNESFRINVIYSPESATEMDYSITFKVLTAKLCVRDFLVPCKGQGKSPILSFSHTQMSMAAIPCDATAKESIEVVNISSTPYTMCLTVPPVELGRLFVCPVCCTLKPKEKRRLQIEFKPDVAYTDLLEMPEEVVEPPAEADPAADPAAAEEEEEKPPELPQEEKERRYKLRKLRETRMHGGRRWESGDGGVHSHWKLAISLRPKAAGKGQNGDDRLSRAVVSTTYLGVRTCVVPAVLTVHPTTLDFGEVTAQQRMVKTITLRNQNRADPQKLRMDPLPENACFTVLNAPREVRQKPFQLAIEFKPQFAQIYGTTLRLYSQKTRVQVHLKGKGVRPVLKINPEGGILHLGSVVYSQGATDYVTKDLTILNESPFELKFALDSIIPAEQNHVGVPPFTLTPATGTVKGHGEKKVTVTFRPHRPLEVFKEKLLVNVPNQKENTYVYLYGHCFMYQAYAMYDLDKTGQNFLRAFGREDIDRPDAFVDSLAVGAGAPSLGDGGQFQYSSSQRKHFLLEFERGETQKNLLVGASVAPGTPKAPQQTSPATYDFQIVPSEFSEYFFVEAPGQQKAKAAKGTVQAGAPASKIGFVYNPPSDTSLNFGDMTLTILEGIGQWITCTVKGTLSGGFVPPGESPTQEMTVELKAYLQQI